jgi:hypothetical protein
VKSFNVNHHVWLKLTPAGHKMHRQHYAELGCLQYFSPEIDADGWTRFQLWSAMNIFGKYLYCGSEPPFEMEIRLEEGGP